MVVQDEYCMQASEKRCCGRLPLLMQVQWVGQPIALVVAESRAIAERAAALVKVRP